MGLTTQTTLKETITEEEVITGDEVADEEGTMATYNVRFVAYLVT